MVKDPRSPTTPQQFGATGAGFEDSRSCYGGQQQRGAHPHGKGATQALFDQCRRAWSRSAKDLTDQLTAIEENIYQTKLHAGEDALNFPIKLNNKIASVGGVVESTDIAPTAQSVEVFNDLSAKLQVELDHLNQVETTGIATFNTLVRDQNIRQSILRNRQQPRNADYLGPNQPEMRIGKAILKKCHQEKILSASRCSELSISAGPRWIRGFFQICAGARLRPCERGARARLPVYPMNRPRFTWAR